MIMGLALGKESSGLVKKTELGDLPESCVAMVLMNLEPKEICKLAKLNRAFRGASSADFVWESKLPSNYQQILEKIFDADDFPANSCKKDIYATLCRFNSMDDGTKVSFFSSLFLKFQGSGFHFGISLESESKVGKWGVFFGLVLVGFN